MKDTYAQNTICYLDDRNRLCTCLRLLTVASTYFGRATLIRDFKLLKSELSFLGHQTRWPELDQFVRDGLLDSVIILLAFEHFMKAVLLEKNFIIHEIDNSSLSDLRKNQKKNPILLEEYLKHDQIYYDEGKKQNRFKFLYNSTLSVSSLLKERNYLKHFDFPEVVHAYLEETRSKRNSLHFHHGDSASFSSKSVNDIQALINFVNERIIQRQNELAIELDFVKHTAPFIK